MLLSKVSTAVLAVLAAAAVGACMLFVGHGVQAAGAGQAYFVPPPFDGRVGPVSFQNTSAYPITVTLWHPDSRTPWRSQTVASGETCVFTNGQGRPARVGNNWGIQLGNSPVKPLERVADWSGTFEVSTDSFWQR